MPENPQTDLNETDASPDKPTDAGSQALAEALRSSFAVVKVVMGILVIAFFASGFFLVGPQERVIILRFGKPQGQGEQALLGPGKLHWSFPPPIDELVKVPITGIQKVTSTVGWYATTPEQELAGTEPYAGPTLNPAVEGYAMTADNNIIHTRATLTYRIRDPNTYVFDFVNASNTIQNVLDNALLFVSSHYVVDDVLTRDVAGFQDAVRKQATDLIEKENIGVAVEQCSVQSVAPRQLKDAFANVLKAEVGRSQRLNEARSYENRVLSQASADSESHINAARSDRARLVKEVSSRAAQFEDLLPKYRDNPSLFVQQRLTETLGRVFTNAQDKIFVPESADGNTMELRYLLNREPTKANGEQAKP
jgi:membrane protease subunit HflK